MNSIYPVILANTKFSIDLLKTVCKNDEASNVLLSPLSISSALGLVVLGAKGETENQMMTTLHFDQMTIMYHDLYEAINKNSAFNKLILANRLYGERSCDFKDDYLDECEDWCFGGLRIADFQNNPEDARVKINNWVKNKTQDKIESLLDAGDVNKDTMLVLVSTMYIQGIWHTPFKDTNEAKFYINQGETKNVQMMSQTGKFPLATIDEADCRILELFYEHKDLSMFIILPNGNDLKKIESLITYEKLLEWTEEDKFILTEMPIFLPKMNMEGTYDLEKILTSLGIIDAFTDKCDFSGMTSKPLKMSKVVHKSGLNMNEQGTEIEAGSGAPTTLLRSNKQKYDSVDGKQVSFVADHPFLFFIRHNDTKSILFWGRFCSP